MPRPAKRTLVHVNMHIARANAKTGATEPCITVKTYDSNIYAHEALIGDGLDGSTMKVVYRPDAPRPNGGTIWMEAYSRVEALVQTAEGTSTVIDVLEGRRAAPVFLRVSKPTIRANISATDHAPVLTLTAGGREVVAHGARIFDAAGEQAAEVVYRPADPLDCGARLWVETRQTVTPWIREPATAS